VEKIRSPIPERASTLELFFDLVFVFTITQVATVVVYSPNAVGVAQAAVQLSVIYWVYDGYAWMTNAAGPDTWQRTVLLLVGMAGFFQCALAVPRAFGEDALVFSLGYMVITVVHLLGFLLRPGRTPLAFIYGIAPGNLISACLILAAAFTGTGGKWVLWLSALGLRIATPMLTRQIRGFGFNAAHFADRHGSMILIVLGESLVAVGLSTTSRRVNLRLLVGELAGFSATAAMWWAYFVGEDTKAARAFEASPPLQRVFQALAGYEAANVVMIYGVIAVATGARLRIDAMTVPAPAFDSWLIAIGASIFLLGSATFRLAMHIGPALPRFAGSLLPLLAAPVGMYISAGAALCVVTLAIATTLVIEHGVEKRSGVSRVEAPRGHPWDPRGQPE
jgi:low temperature requirement protein LtrA